MNTRTLWFAVVFAPLLFIAPLSAQEAKQAVAEKTVEVKNPTLTFYYFDG